MEGQIRLKDFKLNSLLEITTAINSNQNVATLTKLFSFIVQEQLGFDRFLLFNKREVWNCLIRVGYKGKVKDFDIERDLARFKEITVIESSQSKILSGFDIVVPVYHKEEPLAY